MNYMSDKTFVDTNVLIYAHDVDAGEKQEIAKGVFRTFGTRRPALLACRCSRSSMSM